MKKSIVILFVIVFATAASAATVYFEESFNGAFDNPADMALGGTAYFSSEGVVMPVDGSVNCFL